MAAHGLKRARPAELVPGTVQRDHRAHGLPAARARRADWQAVELARLQRPQRGAWCRSMPGAATTTRCCAQRLQQLADRLQPRRWARSATACSPTRRRCWRSSWPRAAAWAGAASTRWCCTARRARCSSWARSIVDLALPLTAPVERALRQLQRLHRRLPDAGHRRAVPARCAALHLLPDDRARRADPESSCARAIGNRIYGCDDCQLACPWNKFAQRSAPARLRPARRPRRRHAAAAVGLERGRVPAPHRRQRDPPHRLRALAAQPGGGAGQCLARDRRRGDRRGAGRPRCPAPTRCCASTSTGRWRSGCQAAGEGHPVGRIHPHPGAARCCRSPARGASG